MTINIDREIIQNPETEDEIIKKTIEYALNYVDCPYEASLDVLLTDNASIHQINKEQRDIDRATDVLSFPMLEYDEPGVFPVEEELDDFYFELDSGELLLGSMVISLEKVKEQAEAYGHSEQRELAFLVAHSMLHLFGYDHMEEEERTRMEELQEEILQKAGYTRDC
jgi:probable rRNA maturation factor